MEKEERITAPGIVWDGTNTVSKAQSEGQENTEDFKKMMLSIVVRLFPPGVSRSILCVSI